MLRIGLHPKIIRKVQGNPCPWCANLVGVYDYPCDRTVFKRHANCRCIVEYDPADGVGKVQSSYSRKWRNFSKREEVEKKLEKYAKVQRTKLLNSPKDNDKINSKYKLDLQFFAEKNLKDQSIKSLKKGIRSFEKLIAKHEEYIKNPSLKAKDWDSYSIDRKNGLIKHWKKEIAYFKDSINTREQELQRREKNGRKK